MVTLWLWWRTGRPVAGDLAVRLRVLARDFRPIAESISYPAAGTTTFDQLPAGTVLADGHSLRLPRDLDTPDYLRIEVDLLDRRSGTILASQRGPVTVGPLRVTSEAWPPPGMDRAMLEVDDRLRLDAARIEAYPPEREGSGGSLALLLAWTAKSLADEAFVEVALLDRAGRSVLTVDRGLGSWHAPQFWQPGDRFVDELNLELPAGLPVGDYRLHLSVTVDGKKGEGTIGTVRR